MRFQKPWWVVNMTTRAMLATERCPKANDDWEEDFEKSERTWTKWKAIYRAADLKAKGTKKANDVQFGELVKKTTARVVEETRLIEKRVISPIQSRPRN